MHNDDSSANNSGTEDNNDPSMFTMGNTFNALSAMPGNFSDVTDIGFGFLKKTVDVTK